MHLNAILALYSNFSVDSLFVEQTQDNAKI